MNLTYLKNVTTLKLNAGKCNGCRKCIEVCPHEVFEIRDKKAFIKDKSACMECGACAKNCQQEAIEVDAGVGCAAAIILGVLTGREPSCGPSGCCGSAKSSDNGPGCCGNASKT